jgi:hypothetical protein
MIQNFTNLTLGDTVPMLLDQVVDLEGNSISNLAGHTVFFTLKRTPLETDANALVNFTSPANITIAADRATWEVPAATTANLKPARPYPYDVQIKDSDSRIFTVQTGVLVFADQVTIRTS